MLYCWGLRKAVASVPQVRISLTDKGSVETLLEQRNAVKV